MRLPELTRKDVWDILIIFMAVTLLAVAHFLITDFPLVPQKILLDGENKTLAIPELQGSHPVDLETFMHFRTLDSTLVIDTRSRDVYRKGHIPGAVNIPYDEGGAYLSRFEQMTAICRVITYCDGDECMSSIELAEELVFLFPEVYFFFGGWSVWKDGDNPVETGKGRAL